MKNGTTIESSPDAAARLVRALKAKDAEEVSNDKADWFEISPTEVREKLGKESIWDEPPVPRGRAFEELRSANLGSNYPVIDDIRIDAGTATSMKTLDLSTEPYQNVEAIDSTIRGYVDKLSTFTGFTWRDREYQKGKDFQDLYLELGIPAGKANSSQVSKLQELQDYAQDKDVRLVVVKVA